MKKSFHYLFLFLFGVLLLPFSVHAEGKTLTYKTTISNWQPNNSLYVIPATYPENVTYTWKLECDDESIDLDEAEGEVFIDIDNTCTEAKFVEIVDFTNMTPDNVGFSTNNDIAPSSFDQTKGVLDVATVTAFAFSGLETSYYPVTFYSLNEVDDEGNIIGGPYVEDVYFTNDNEKTVEQNLGSILLPEYAVRIGVNVKGNIANPNGTFFITDVDSGDVHTIDNDLSVTNTKEIPLSLEQFKTFYMSPYTVLDIQYGFDGEADTSYEISPMVTHDDLENIEQSIEIDGNTFYIGTIVSATLNGTNSETGLFYNIWPFAIMILFAGAFVVLFFMKKKKAKAAVIVDEEVL